MSLISSLLLDDSPLSASTDVLKYSPDGQIAVVTRGAIYIVTPDLSSSPHVEKNIFRGDRLGWSKTAIHDIGITKAWSDGRTGPRKEWNTLSLATVENLWQAVSWSPSGLNRLGGCLLASLTNNLQVIIWAPVKNPLTGEWSKVADITEYQISSYGGDDEITAEDLQKCQSCSIAWSDSLHKEEAFPSTAPCHSLLAVGARSGDVSFFRWDLKVDAARYCFSSKVADAWITKLTWSNWRLENRTGSSQFGAASLACGLSNGSVWVLNIKQELDGREQYSVDSTLVAEPDSRSITAMTFVESNSKTHRLLAVAKPGFIAFCTLPTLSENDMAEDPSLDIIKLSSPRTSLASSAVSTCVGMQYIASNDSMVVILAEGSTITITGIFQKARVIEQEESGTSTYNLSKAVRRVTGIAENRPLDRTEYARIYGVQFMETENYVLWGQEVLHSYDLSFRIQATSKIKICLVKLWRPEEDTNTRLVSSLGGNLLSYNLVASYSPGVILKQILFELLEDESVVSVAPHMLPILAPEWGLTNLNQFADEGHTSLTIDDPFTGQTRLKLSLVQLLVNRVSLPENLIVELRSLERTLMQTVVALRIHTVVERIISSPESDEFEKAGILRFIHASQFCPIPGSVSQRFQNMRKQGQDYARRHDSSLTYLSNDERDTLDLSRATDLGETCPACQQVVLFQNLAQARCHTGHVWERCATSFRLLASLGSLTCSGCGRKSLDHNPQILAEPGTHCVMCGNRYFRAI
ncbi:putative zinc-finger of transcription factor IIIC complex, partial [Rhizoctonia solani]